MNFSELYAELVEVLAENTIPQYWQEAELKRYLNRGQRELVKLGQLNTILLPLGQAETGAFYLPTDVLKLKRVYYAGKALDHKSVDYLDSAHGGTAHMQVKSGNGNTYTNNWRKEKGIPIHWYFENNKIKLYPTPESDAAALSVVRGKLTGTISAGDAGISLADTIKAYSSDIAIPGITSAGYTSITLSRPIPLDQARVMFYFNGIYQNKDQWTITDANTITFVGWSVIADAVYEVVYIPDEDTREKLTGTISAGDIGILLGDDIPLDKSRVAFYLNGVYQNQDQWSISDATHISFAGWSPLADSAYEIVYIPDSVTITMSVSVPAAPNVIPLDQNRVDLFINGVYQNKDQWQITNSGRIDFIKSDGTTWAAIVDNDYEIVYIPDSVSLTTIQKSEKYRIFVSAAQTTVVVPGGYIQGIGALAVRKNGVTQAPGAFTETAPGFITIPAPVADCTYEITVTRTDPALTASILYIQRPIDMSNDADRPLIDNEDWQRGIIHYAAYLALTKEGKMTQDLQKGQIHAQRFNEVVDDILSVSGADIDVAPVVEMPFFV